MKKGIRLFAIVSALVMCLSIFGISANAAEVKRTESGNVFTDDWETTEYFDNGRGTFTYGFHTWWADEDYARCYHNTNTHSASVSAGGVTATTNSASAGEWTDTAEVGHASGTVTFKAYY